jgi:hypothetical protein
LDQPVEIFLDIVGIEDSMTVQLFEDGSALGADQHVVWQVPANA